ncbi:MAG: hypothetical protein ACLGJE_18315 [Gammaproteobacteria bacterium]
MPLTKPNQELHRTLEAAADEIEAAVQDLFIKAKSYDEPEFLSAMERISRIHDHVDILRTYAKQLLDGAIVMISPE